MGVRFQGAGGLWKIQNDLLALQRDVQAAISEAKARLRDGEGDYNALENLRLARWHSRRLGDALAWLVLDLDRRIIASLANNQRVSIPVEDHGSRGLMAIASHLASEGMGFPLLHDVTDCLRIGDVTFVQPDLGRDGLRTIEVKTRFMGERAADGGGKGYEYQVGVLSASPFDIPQARVKAGREDSQTENGPLRGWISKSRRQLERMSSAVARQRAPEGRPIEIDGERMVTKHIETSARSYWASLRRVIRRSRVSGYASESVDGAFLYGALYCADGVDKDLIDRSRLAEDLVESGILWRDAARDAVVMNLIPAPEGAAAQLFMPFYLYPIPKTAIADIVHGRLYVVVLANMGRIVAALERAGFEVILKQGRHPLAEGALVLRSSTMIAGKKCRVDIRNIAYHYADMVYGFNGVEYLVDIAKAILAGAEIEHGGSMPSVGNGDRTLGETKA
jgi:hypothetical protein